MEHMHTRRLIIPRGVLQSGNNVIEIPESCEDSRVIIAKEQPRKPSRHRSGPGRHPQGHGGCVPQCPSLLHSSRGSVSSASKRHASPHRINITVGDGILPDELNNEIINESLAELEHVELEELRVVQDKMRKFQDARRELVISILMLQEAEVGADKQ